LIDLIVGQASLELQTGASEELDQRQPIIRVHLLAITAQAISGFLD